MILVEQVAHRAGDNGRQPDLEDDRHTSSVQELALPVVVYTSHECLIQEEVREAAEADKHALEVPMSLQHYVVFDTGLCGRPDALVLAGICPLEEAFDDCKAQSLPLLAALGFALDVVRVHPIHGFYVGDFHFCG